MMKPSLTATPFGALLLAMLGLPACLAAQDSSSSEHDEAFPPRLAAFCQAKQDHARQLAKKLDLTVSPQVWSYLEAAGRGDWNTVSNLFEKLKKRSSQYEGASDDRTVGTVVWQTIIEVQTALEQFQVGNPKYAFAFGDGIIRSVPQGSIYFGGTDPGRGLVTALCKSHANADPFFTITQNALADGRYLTYLQETYGERIYIPSMEDSQKAFQDYLADAQRRLQHDREFPDQPRQIKPGEDIRMIDNRVQVSGQVAVMSINGLLTKIIFDRNTNHQFYVEESFPLDWMYPHLSPHGLILKINREPLDSLPAATVEKDLEFWAGQVKPMIGGWLQPGTPVEEVCAFADKTFVRKDLEQFAGDPDYVRCDPACKNFSKLRSSIGGLYAWRLSHATDADEKERMIRAADLAFRQAYALCPYSPEAIFRYVNLLVSLGRLEDALRVALTSAKLDPENNQIQSLVEQLQMIQRKARAD